MNVPEDTVCLATVGKFVPDLQIHLHTHRPVENKNITYRHYMDTWLHTKRQYLLLFLKTENTFLNRLIVKFTKLLAF